MSFPAYMCTTQHNNVELFRREKYVPSQKQMHPADHISFRPKILLLWLGFYGLRGL